MVITTTNAGEDVAKQKPYTLLVGMQIVQPPWKAVWRFLEKLDIQLPCDP
jgi:hypothetical protein